MQMRLKDFDISFVGLKDGTHQFRYDIDETFFDLFDYSDLGEAKIQVVCDFKKSTTMMELQFNIQGSTVLPCDISNELFSQSIISDLFLVVKFGEFFNDEDDEILILPHGSHKFNVAQYIYEGIVLAVPAKRIHPGIEDGSLSSDALERLEALSPGQSNEEESNKAIDPRWDKLKKLKNNN
jgi:uncharacterized metal-binding protein YceD (DUF177 family)